MSVDALYAVPESVLGVTITGMPTPDTVSGVGSILRPRRPDTLLSGVTPEDRAKETRNLGLAGLGLMVAGGVGWLGVGINNITDLSRTIYNVGMEYGIPWMVNGINAVTSHITATEAGATTAFVFGLAMTGIAMARGVQNVRLENTSSS